MKHLKLTGAVMALIAVSGCQTLGDIAYDTAARDYCQKGTLETQACREELEANRRERETAQRDSSD